jgi:NRPS condensation-like uncharacterized protein
MNETGLLDRKTRREKSVLLIRFNHAYLDGLSFVMFFKEHLGRDFEYAVNPLKFKIPLWKRIMFYATSIIYGPAHLVHMMIAKSRRTPWVLRTDTNNNIASVKNFAWTDYIPSSQIKKIRLNCPGGNAAVNEIIAVALISAIKQVLPPERIPDELVMGTILALLPYPNSHPQNRFTNYSYRVPTGGGIPKKE